MHGDVHVHSAAHVHAGRAAGIVGAAAGDDVHMVRLHLLVQVKEGSQAVRPLFEDLLHGFRLQEDIVHHGHVLIHLLSPLHGPRPLY